MAVPLMACDTITERSVRALSGNRRSGRQYLSILHDSVFRQPLERQRTMLLSPVLLELVLGQVSFATGVEC